MGRSRRCCYSSKFCSLLTVVVLETVELYQIKNITVRITYNVLKDFISVRKSSEEFPLDKSDILLQSYL